MEVRLKYASVGAIFVTAYSKLYGVNNGAKTKRGCS